MPRGGARPNSGPKPGYKKTPRATASPTAPWLRDFRKADAHARIHMCAEQLVKLGKFEEAARTLAKVVPYEVSRMGLSRRAAPLSSVQRDLFDLPEAAIVEKADPTAPDEFVGLLN